ncbi:MaoC like domain-containing protein [Aspergillus foveolatus]|uniref:MaoC like domain-containing protein n=1 Tax=Aspergillus foveolatus TaxID=210207 RepID=UPI003CCDE8F8
MDLNQIKRRHWTTSITYDASNIITYNLSIASKGRNLRHCWEEHPEFHALPTFSSLAVIDIMGKVTVDMPKLLPLYKPNKHPHVHAEHYLEMRGPLPKSGTLTSNARILDVVDRRTGVAVIVGISTKNGETGEGICCSEWTSFLMKMPGDGASKPSSSMQSTLLPNREPDAVLSHQTTPEQGALYRAATGEWNPMHIDPATAQHAGFPGTILSGTCTIGIGVNHVIEAFAGGDSARFQSLRLRLSKPVFPGEIVTTKMWRVDETKIVYQQVAEDGRVVISNAEIRLKAGGGKQRSQL